MKRTITATLFLFSSVISAESLTTGQTVAEWTWQATQVVDVLQTLEIVESDYYFETNPILGKYPTKNEVYVYFTIRGIAHWYVTNHVPKRYRWTWLILTNLSNLSIIHGNYKIGIRIDF